MPYNPNNRYSPFGSNQYRRKVKGWSDKHLDNRIKMTSKRLQAMFSNSKNWSKKNPNIHSQELDRYEKKVNTLLDEKARRSRKKKPKKGRRLERSQNAIANMYKYWLHQDDVDFNREGKLHYYSRLKDAQSHLGRKLTLPERRKLYKYTVIQRRPAQTVEDLLGVFLKKRPFQKEKQELRRMKTQQARDTRLSMKDAKESEKRFNDFYDE